MYLAPHKISEIPLTILFMSKKNTCFLSIIISVFILTQTEKRYSHFQTLSYMVLTQDHVQKRSKESSNQNHKGKEINTSIIQ